MDDTIHIVFATDNGYIKQLLIALTSIVHNTTARVHAYVLDVGISAENLGRLKLCCEKLGIASDILPVSREFIGQFPASAHYKQATYGRLQVPSLLKHLDKVLYCDPDILVRHDLRELWQTDISNVSAAVNRDMDVEFLDPIKKAVGLGKEHTYFNAGVMLLNLARLRSINFEQQALQFAKEHPERINVVDQDILNSLLRDDVVRFRLKWNYSPVYYRNKNYRKEGGSESSWQNFNTLCSPEEQREAETDPGILHFHNRVKPWHCTTVARLHPWYAEYFRYVDLYHERIGELWEPLPDARLTAILPCYNVQAFINKAVDSVLSQKMREIAIVAIDDGSTDETGAILDDYARWDRRIRVVHQPNGGLGAAYNRGISLSNTEYLAFVEPDDWVDYEGFERLVAHADENRCQIVKADFCLVQGDAISRYNKCIHDSPPTIARLSDLLSSPYGHVGFWAGIYRRDFLDQNQIRFLELPGAGYVDLYFFWRTHVRADRISLLRRVVYYYRIHAGASIAAATVSKAWPCLITNYTAIADAMIAEGSYELYRETFLHVMYHTVRYVAGLLDDEGRAALLLAAKPLLSDIRLDSDRGYIPEGDKRGIRAMLQGKLEVPNPVAVEVKRRFRWTTGHAYLAGDLARLRQSKVVQVFSSLLGFVREIGVFFKCLVSLALNFLRALYKSLRWRVARLAGFA